MTFNLTCFLALFNYEKRVGIEKLKFKGLSLFVLIVCTALHIKSSNYQQAFSDVFDGKAKNFSNQMQIRLNELKFSGQNYVIFESIKLPKTIYTQDLFEDPNNWGNACFTEAINRLYDLNVKSVKVKTQ